MFAQVILPLPLHDFFTYRVPIQWQNLIEPGQRVVVQFGSKKLYSALVYSLDLKAPENMEIKEIMELLDEEPVILPLNLEMWKWMANYYCCTLGDVFRAALPPGLKLESKSKIYLKEDWDELEISESERDIINQFSENEISLDLLLKKLGKGFSYPSLKTLLEKNIIKIEEKISEKFRPKSVSVVSLHPTINTEEILHQTIDSLERAKKQKALLVKFCEETLVFHPNQKSFISKKKLLNGSGFTSSLLNELTAKGILVISQMEISRIIKQKIKQADLNPLNPYQLQALGEVKAIFHKKQVALMHGITASGKTEIYIYLIEEVLKKGMQALYLLPEISLTTQIVERLKNVFGAKVGIYHSRLNDHERLEIWNKVLQFQTNPKDSYQVILGTRSALFMPFSKLGLIVVDEEHENSFKQFEPAPRYHARDMAVVMGKLYQADVLLGSATPSYESYFNVLNKKYGLVKLEKRHSEIELPEIIVADIKRANKKKQMRSVLTPDLYLLMEEAFKNKEQVVLFQNRRGFSPYIQCMVCGTIPKCKNCDVTLTYHKYKKRLICHYCGYSTKMFEECPDCGSGELNTRGFGTEKVEEELRVVFPDARIERMDLDTTRSKNAFGKIISNVESGKTNILIGTQMVTKGLDFEHVRVVGILNADNLINFPDFRAHERAYQLVSQVSGRAGRKHSRGKVVLQTSQPQHPLVELIQRQDYLAAFSMQMQERKLFKYPPFARLIKVVVKHKNPETVQRVADDLARGLRSDKSLTVLGPEFPLVNRIQLWYTKEIWLKLSRHQQTGDVKLFVMNNIRKIKKETSSCIIYMDVDPY